MSTLASSASASSGRISRRGARMRRKLKRQSFSLQLTSLMDVLMIIVVFLLKSYGISNMGVVQTPNLQLPISQAPETFGEGMALIIAKDRILLDNEELLLFQGDIKTNPFVLPSNSIDKSAEDRGILPLFDALAKRKSDYELLAKRSQDPEAAAKGWSGELLVQADREAPYDLLRRVMYTAGMAGYRSFRLTVEKQAE